ncbi:MAG: DUF6707 family protein [Galactobacter sp.]|uniref:DUF6707 family protein n=1 Tax=Galactobacter sp. TaxID=2676125 RepID=UPI0025C496A0|nr:DUF6707 family protein [Galactobacter sp.]
MTQGADGGRFSGRFSGPRSRRQAKAREIAAGDRFMRRDGLPSSAVVSTRVLRDSFGSDMCVEAVLEDRTQVRIAIGSTVRVYTDRTPPPGLKDLLTMTVPETGPEAALLSATEAHREDAELVRIALNLVPGINVRAGAHLADLATAVDRLIVVHADLEAARPLLTHLTDRGFDGNENRWWPVRHGLALAAWLAVADDDSAAAAAFGTALRSGEDEVLAEMRGPAARIRRHEMTRPASFDREIQRASELGRHDDEARLRWARLDQSLTQLATGWAGWNQSELLATIALDVEVLRDLEAPVSG